MPSRIAPALTRLQRLLPWSNTPRAWLERLSLAGVLAAVVALVAYAGGLALWQLVMAWAALLLTAAVLFRRGWLRAFGPILWYDLVRTSRRVRTYLIRAAYLLILLAVLWLLYLNEWPHGGGRGRLMNSQIARFAEQFFYTFLITQYVLMVLLAPAYTAGAIAEEKQKKTMQFLLATDLRNHEIVLGKLGSRLAHLGLLLLAGLPVLGAVQFLGGVDPHLVLAGFAGTAVTLASAAGVSILASALVRSARTAVFLAYGTIVLYVALCWLGQTAPFWFHRQPFNAAAVSNPWMVDNLLAALEAGNPVAAVNDTFSGDPIETALLRALGAYALFHGVVALATTLTASILVRRASLREPAPPGAKAARRRPPVGDQPMLWKEIHAERSLASRWFVTLPIALLLAASFAFLIWIWYEQVQWRGRYQSGDDYSWQVWRGVLNGWVRTVGTVLACLSLLGVAVHAAHGIRVERERETFDSLLTSPLSSEDILYGKWLGAILSARRLLPWLGLVWGVGVLGGGLHPMALPLLMLAWCVYAAALASLGVWFSLTSRTSFRAMLYTILTVLALSVGHWLLWLPCAFVGLLGRGTEWVLMAEAGLTPPVVLGGFFSFGYEEHMPTEIFSKLIAFSLGGLVAWGVFAWMALQAANLRFKQDGGRVDTGATRLPPSPLYSGERGRGHRR